MKDILRLWWFAIQLPFYALFSVGRAEAGFARFFLGCGVLIILTVIGGVWLVSWLVSLICS